MRFFFFFNVNMGYWCFWRGHTATHINSGKPYVEIWRLTYACAKSSIGSWMRWRGLACLDELPPVVTEQFSSLIQGMCVACLLCARHRCTRGEQTWQAKRTKAHMNLYLYPAHSGKKQKNWIHLYVSLLRGSQIKLHQWEPIYNSQYAN